MTLTKQSRKSEVCSEENANGSNSNSHRSSNGQKAHEKSGAAVPNRQRRSCGLWHKINWTVGLVAFSLPPRIDKSSEKKRCGGKLRGYLEAG
jgi:hypothetical protein